MKFKQFQSEGNLCYTTSANRNILTTHVDFPMNCSKLVDKFLFLLNNTVESCSQ